MTKEEFDEITKNAVPQILKARSVLRNEILKAADENEQQQIKDSLCDFGSDNLVEKENLNAKLPSIATEAKNSFEDITFQPEIFHSLRKRFGAGTLEKISPMLDDAELGLAKRFRENSFAFEDIALLTDESVKTILQETDFSEIAKTFKICDEKTKEKILSNMSKRAGDMLLEDVEFMGPVRICDAKAAEQKILDCVLKCSAKGKVKFE